MTVTFRGFVVGGIPMPDQAANDERLLDYSRAKHVGEPVGVTPHLHRVHILHCR